MLLERTREVADATRRPARIAAGVMGGLFLLAGILGFIPGVTSDYSSMALSGHYSEARLLGVFQVSVLHNLLHLFLGVAGLAAAWKGARFSVDKLFGPIPFWANFISFNGIDDWMRFLVSTLMLSFYFVVRPGRGVPE